MMARATGALQPQPTIYLVDDDASVRVALSRLFRSVGYAVRAFETAQAYLEEASPGDPGCVVLDIMMPGMDGLTLQDRMSERGLSAPIVFISAHGSISASVRAMKHGAVDFLEKPFEDQDLLDAVERAIELDGEVRKLKSVKSEVQYGLDRLTSREYEILTYVISGRLNKVIARELGVSEKTVKVHPGRVMKKMGARSLANLVRMAETVGIEPAKRRDSGGVV